MTALVKPAAATLALREAATAERNAVDQFASLRRESYEALRDAATGTTAQLTQLIQVGEQLAALAAQVSDADLADTAAAYREALAGAARAAFELQGRATVAAATAQ
jgi:hypothetical protein